MLLPFLYSPSTTLKLLAPCSTTGLRSSKNLTEINYGLHKDNALDISFPLPVTAAHIFFPPLLFGFAPLPHVITVS